MACKDCKRVLSFISYSNFLASCEFCYQNKCAKGFCKNSDKNTIRINFIYNLRKLSVCKLLYLFYIFYFYYLYFHRAENFLYSTFI